MLDFNKFIIALRETKEEIGIDISKINIYDLLNKSIICEKQIVNSENIKVNVPCFFIEDLIIWGATAMVISELIQVIREAIE